VSKRTVFDTPNRTSKRNIIGTECPVAIVVMITVSIDTLQLTRNVHLHSPEEAKLEDPLRLWNRPSYNRMAEERARQTFLDRQTVLAHQ
jgi:hypothetical protein